MVLIFVFDQAFVWWDDGMMGRIQSDIDYAA